MKSLFSVAITVPFATVMLFAQATQADKAADQADRPAAGAATQADRPAAGASSQADRPAPSTQAERPAGQAGAASQSSTQSTTQSTTSSQSTRTTGQADIGGAKTYTGTIVKADCSEASILTSSMAASASTSAGATAADQSKSTSSKNPPKSRYDLSREVIKHCAASKDATAFAVVTDDGNFLKLDDSGNQQVKTNKWGKNTKVSVNGSVEGDTLKTQAITKM
jgi:hypothetical protein